MTESKETDPKPTASVVISEYLVSPLPSEHSLSRQFAIRVARHGDEWVVRDGIDPRDCKYLSADGEWDAFELESRWWNRHTFRTEDEAMELAKRAVWSRRVSGRLPKDFLL